SVRALVKQDTLQPNDSVHYRVAVLDSVSRINQAADRHLQRRVEVGKEGSVSGELPRLVTREKIRSEWNILIAKIVTFTSKCAEQKLSGQYSKPVDAHSIGVFERGKGEDALIKVFLDSGQYAPTHPF